MPMPAAKKGDQIVGVDTHFVNIPGTPPVVTLQPCPFSGMIDGGLSRDVKIMGREAATADSTATNTQSHIPAGGSFVKNPSNRGKIIMGSQTVFINGKSAARSGDTALTCNDPQDMPVGTVIAMGTVFIG